MGVAAGCSELLTFSRTAIYWSKTPVENIFLWVTFPVFFLASLFMLQRCRNYVVFCKMLCTRRDCPIAEVSSYRRTTGVFTE